MGNDEFTVHLISTASMNYFSDNTLAFSGNSCIEEVALDGDWRVALRNNFSNEIKQEDAFEDAFDQKIGSVYSPNGTMMLEIEIVADRNKFVDL